MKNATTLTKEAITSTENVSIEISKVGVGAIGVASVLIGCWAVVCLVAGMISTGGPMGLVSSFVTAITG